MNENCLHLLVHTDPPGIIDAPACRNLLICIHLGEAVETICRRGGERFRGTAVHGDIDIIPANTPSHWHLTKKKSEMILFLSPELMATVAEQLELDPSWIEIRNRFQIRDLHLENIGWALKAEMESGYLSGRLYSDSLAVAIASRLLTRHSLASLKTERPSASFSLSGRKLKQVLAYIEDNLSRNLSLDELAAVAELSGSRFKIVFRQATGISVHQYVIQRRIERAKTLLREDDMTISQIALETGFAHQSHLARHMRRLLGVSPKVMRDLFR
jgi:AraC family transcriptional regulator